VFKAIVDRKINMKELVLPPNDLVQDPM
jgi:hypothetical protein